MQHFLQHFTQHFLQHFTQHFVQHLAIALRAFSKSIKILAEVLKSIAILLKFLTPLLKNLQHLQHFKTKCCIKCYTRKANKIKPFRLYTALVALFYIKKLEI